MCNCSADRQPRISMAEVVERCAAQGVGTSTQFVARWTEVAVVARERGYLGSGIDVSFDNASAVDAAAPVIGEAIGEAIADEDGCGQAEGRARASALVSKLARPQRERRGGGAGKRRSVARPKLLRDVVDGGIEHEGRWNRCAELVAERELSMKAAVLLFAATMFCFTKDFVCTLTRAQLMAISGIRTPASFAAAVLELMEHSLLSPKDGAPRTLWYLGEGFWGGVLAGEELDTPVALLARSRRGSTKRPKSLAAAGAVRSERSVAKGHVGAEQATGGDGERRRRDAPGTGVENRTSAAVDRDGTGTSRTGTENRTSERSRQGRRTPAAPAVGQVSCRAERTAGTGIENRTSGLRSARELVSVGTFAADELAGDPLRVRIEDRLADYYGSRGEYRIARGRLRGLAVRIRLDAAEPAPNQARGGTPANRQERARETGADRVGPGARCRWCNGPFDHKAARGDRGDGVCRACDALPRARQGPVKADAIADAVGRRLAREAAARQ